MTQEKFIKKTKWLTRPNDKENIYFNLGFLLFCIGTFMGFVVGNSTNPPNELPFVVLGAGLFVNILYFIILVLGREEYFEKVKRE